MAFASTTVFDVQSGGSDSNGGGWDTASTGTDGSQSTTPIASYTDIVIGATTTQGTSVLRPFVATDVGNILNVQSGTGFTVQRAQIVSVAGVTATFDKSLGTAASTGGTGILGGCLATPRPTTTAGLVAGNQVQIKAATYTQTTTMTFSTLAGTQTAPIEFIGYQTTHNDGGTKPLLTTATNTVPLFTLISCPFFEWKNISFSNTAATKAQGMVGLTTTSAGYWAYSDCIFDGFNNGIDSSTNSRGPNQIILNRCTLKNCTLSSVSDSTSGYINVSNSVFYNNTSAGYRWTSINQVPNFLTFYNNVFAKNATGFIDSGTTRTIAAIFLNNTFVDNTTVDISVAETTTSPQLTMTGNIFYGSTTGVTFAFSGGIDKSVLLNDYNAYGANTTDRNGLSAGLHDFTLTANPFVSRATQNYALNNTAGGGALLRAANYPGVLNVGGTGYLDVGALQHQDTGGTAATVAYTFS